MSSKVKGGWRGRVRVGQHDISEFFLRKAQADAWEHEKKQELKYGVTPDKTVAEALERYRDEVSPTKRGHKWEYIRLNAFLKNITWVDEPIASVTVPMIAKWRDDRLKDVSAPSVRREMGMLSSVFEIARREWQWIKTNPCRDVNRPPSNPHRTRRVSEDEIERICFALGYDATQPAESKAAETAVAFLLALETAMRLGEILGLRRQDVDLRRRVASLPRTKNGHARDVPLSGKSLELLRQLRSEDDRLFSVSPQSCDALFRKYVKRSGVENLHFHDARKEATARLAKKLDVMDLAKVTGHRDLRMLLDCYYHPSAAEIAEKLS